MEIGEAVAAYAEGSWFEGKIASISETEIVVTLVGWAGPLDWPHHPSTVKPLAEAEAMGVDIKRPWQGELLADNARVKEMMKRAIRI